MEWLCDTTTAVSATDFLAAAAEEGLFVATPTELAWHVDADTDDMATEDTVSALDRLLQTQPAEEEAEPTAAAADVDMADAPLSPTAMDVASSQQQQPLEQQPQEKQQMDHVVQPDEKLSLLLQLHPQLRRVGIALGVEVRGGVQQQVPVEIIYRWPLLMALAEQLHLPMEQLFQVGVCARTGWLRMIQPQQSNIADPAAAPDGDGGSSCSSV